MTNTWILILTLGFIAGMLVVLSGMLLNSVPICIVDGVIVGKVLREGGREVFWK